MSDLTQKKCVACEGFETPLNKVEAEVLLKQVPSWKLSPDATQISKTFKFKDWKQAFEFVKEVSAIAEEEGHHPDVDLHWGRVGVEFTTHAIKGLSENDFIVAAKIEKTHNEAAQ